MFQKILKFFPRHKFVTALVIIIIVAIAGFAIHSMGGGAGQTVYVLSTVERGTIVSSISGSGQVSASNQIDITSKAASTITDLKVQKGQEVKEGDILVSLDAKDAVSSVRDAQISLDNANLSLQKLKNGSTESEITASKLQLDSAQKNYDQAKGDLEVAKTKADTDLNNTYDDAKSALQSVYSSLDDSLNRQLDGIFINNNTDNAKLSFLTADSSAEYDTYNLKIKAKNLLSEMKDFLQNYPSDHLTIDNKLSEFSSDLTMMQNFFSRLSDAVNGAIVTNSVSQSTISGYKSTVASLKSTGNSSVNSINTQIRNIANQKTTNVNNIRSAENKIADASTSLTKAGNDLKDLQVGSDPLDIRAQELQVAKAQINLSNAQEKLADYTIKASFDGVIAEVPIKKGDNVTANGAILSLITKQQIAEISLNEVDAASVKVGQLVTLTLDAIEGLSITGKVADVDSLGTVSQGVVSYNTKVTFDTQDSRVKPGMSISASIITNTSQNVLTVPNSAIKNSNGSTYVEVLDESGLTTVATGVTSKTAPRQQQVVVGLSDDSYTEIVSGLDEGAKVVSKTIAATASKSNSSAPSLLQNLGGSNRAGSAGASTGNRTFQGGGPGM
ncbi:MAG: efflux RND transporter periplasmic adaptor subunit [Candidatus Buchananbacteria bacterium]